MAATADHPGAVNLHLHQMALPPVTQFSAPKESLGTLNAEAAAALIAAAGDVSLVLSRDGIVRDVAFGNEELAREWPEPWRGKSWIDLVSSDSRPKVETLLREALSGTPPRWRHLNHPSPRGPDVPIQYTVVQVGRDGRVVAVGRDLRSLAVLQQRLVEAQQSMERDYSRLRQVETRYRLLFQTTPEAILIVDSGPMKVTEANPAATTLFGQPTERILGRPLSDLFDPADAGDLQALLAGVRATGRSESLQARGAVGAAPLLLNASLFRQEGTALFLVRVTPPQTQAVTTATPASRGLQILESLPDGFVLTDMEGRIQDANTAFLDLAQLAAAEQARGESLERWLGRPGVDLSVLIANLRQHGAVRLYATTMRGEYGASAEIEVSAATTDEGGRPGFAFVIRNVGRRLAADSQRRELPRSVEQLAELVGRVPLKDLVRETTDVVERLCIEAALELTGDNRASAAEILGLSRQSLYVKLRRYGLGDIDSDDAE